MPDNLFFSPNQIKKQNLTKTNKKGKTNKNKTQQTLNYLADPYPFFS